MKKIAAAVVCFCLLLSELLVFAEPFRGDKLPIDETAKELIGCWEEIEMDPGDAVLDNHNFYSDGTYRFIYSEADELKSRYFEDGFWEIEDQNLMIYLTSQTIRVGGTIEYRDLLKRYIVVDYELREEIINPPKLVFYSPIKELDIQYDEMPGYYMYPSKYLLKMKMNEKWFCRSFYLPEPRNEEEEKSYYEELGGIEDVEA